MGTSRLLISGLSMCVIALSAGSALAQSSQANESVFERARPDYDAKGLPMGAFRVKPTLNVAESYNDNIFAAESNEQEDFITTVKPGISVESNWSSHSLTAYTNGAFGFYADNEDENYEDYGTGIDLRLDVLRETYLFAGANYARNHEERGDPNNAAASTEPTSYDLTSANVGVYRGLRRFSLSLDGNYENYAYENGRQSNGTLIQNGDRDRDVYKGTARLGYEILPDYEAFIRGTYNTKDYITAVDDNGINRDSDGYEVEGGLSLDLGGKTRGEVSVGYIEQRFDDASISDIDDVTFGASVLWNPTGITSVRLNIDRTIEETTQANSGAFINTSYGVAVEHELMRNVLLGANASYAEHTYEGGSLNRKDEWTRAGAEAKYLLNSYASLNLNYDYTDRDSSVTGQDYSSNVVTAGVGIKF